MNDFTQPSASTRSLLLRGACQALALAAVTGLTGCQLWPWAGKERTSVITPAIRMATIREIGPRGRDADAAEKKRLTEQLAEQIRTEPDPIVRKAIQETIAEFDTPLADAVILAGLNDDDRDVRVACCRLLARRQDAAAAPALSKLVSTDAELDVRLAAVDALGALKSKAGMPGLAAALKDRDPAMQYAGVEAMKNVTGEDLGNDVAAWRQYAEQALGASPASAIAAQPTAAASR